MKLHIKRKSLKIKLTINTQQLLHLFLVIEFIGIDTVKNLLGG